ncbi:hypothetical protein JCM8547_003063 [Rhodosporidiobolus lusitaniae]
MSSDSNDASVYDVLFNQTIASEEFARHILGPHLMGWIIQIALWGAATAGALDYARSELWHRDPFRRKILLGWVYSWCTLQAAFNMFLLFHWITTQGRDSSSILKPSVINALQPLTTGATAVPVQGFLARRATGLLRHQWSRWLAYVGFSLLLVIQVIFAIFNVVLNYLSHADKLSGELYKLVTFNIVQGIWLWAAAVADVGVTVVLVVVLRKRMAGFLAETDSMLKRLAALAIQSAAYTAILAATAAIASYAIGTDTLMYSAVPFSFWYLLPSCYALALLTAYSSRLILSNPSANSHSSPIGVPLHRFHPNGALTDFSASAAPASCTCGARQSRLVTGPGGGAGIRRSLREKTTAGLGARSGIRVQEEVSVVVEGEEGQRFTLAALNEKEMEREDGLEKGGSDYSIESPRMV